MEFSRAESRDILSLCLDAMAQSHCVPLCSFNLNGTGKGYQCEIKDGKMATSAPNGATRDTTMVTEVPQNDDTWSYSKEQSSRNETVEETRADFKSSNAEPSATASERLDLVDECWSEQVVPHVQQATLSSSSESEQLRHLSNLSPFEYSEDVMVSVYL